MRSRSLSACGLAQAGSVVRAKGLAVPADPACLCRPLSACGSACAVHGTARQARTGRAPTDRRQTGLPMRRSPTCFVPALDTRPPPGPPASSNPFGLRAPGRYTDLGRHLRRPSTLRCGLPGHASRSFCLSPPYCTDSSRSYHIPPVRANPGTLTEASHRCRAAAAFNKPMQRTGSAGR